MLARLYPFRFAACRFAFRGAVTVLLLLLALSGRAALALDVAFTVAMPKPWTHMLDVEMRVTGATSGKAAELVMPVWTPGSYVLREYARNVQDFEAVGADGKPLTWRKTSKNIWQVETGGATAFTAHYRVYANELKVQLLEVTDDHAFWNNAGVLMHVSGALKSPATLTVSAPSGWKIATGLPATAGRPDTFRAEDFDELYDCPVEVGAHDEVTFAVKGVPHRMVFYGKTLMPLERIRDDVQKIVETEVAMMGEIPYRDYTFIVHLRRGAGGGLEHRNSATLGVDPSEFREGYTEFLSLVAHEYFHLWNVKRIRPDALGPFDYSHENHTRLLWVAEGITSYYEPIFLARAGFIGPTGMASYLSSLIQSVESTPGRKEQSLEEASFDTWIKFYKPDENTANSQISYYNKGAVVGMLLDLTIRGKSGGKKSLDDVLRTLYTDYAKKGRNVTPEDFQKVCEVTAGDQLEPFFAKYVRGREELGYDDVLKAFGMHLNRDAPGSHEAYLGASFASDPAGVKVTSVLAETPAYDQGLSANDLVIACDEIRVTSPDELYTRISEKAPGDTIRLTLFRADALRTLEIKLVGRARPLYRIIPLPEATGEQKRLYQEWTGAARR